jgi:hypothetical protein
MSRCTAGFVGAGLAPLIMVVAMLTVVEFVVRREAAGMPIQQGQYGVVIGDTYVLLWFPLIVGAGLYLRRDFEAHKRLMLLAGLTIFGPVFARYVALVDLGVLPVEWLGLLRASAVLLVLLGYDIASRKRPHWVTVCGLFWAATSGPLTDWLAQTAAADEYVEWLRSLS